MWNIYEEVIIKVRRLFVKTCTKTAVRRLPIDDEDKLKKDINIYHNYSMYLAFD